MKRSLGCNTIITRNSKNIAKCIIKTENKMTVWSAADNNVYKLNKEITLKFNISSCSLIIGQGNNLNPLLMF